MDPDDLIIWLVVFSCLGLLVRALWLDRENMRGWLWVSLPILVLTLLGYFQRWPGLLRAGEIAWLVLVLIPSLLSLLYLRFHTRQQFGRAGATARLMRWLHPADGWKELPDLMQALDLAQRGEEERALELFRRHQHAPGANGLVASAQLFRITNRWEEFMDWRKDHLPEETLARHSGLLPLLLRGFGETGDLNGMLAWFEQFEQRVERSPASFRALCRLVVYAFCGRRSRVETLFDLELVRMPAEHQRFWIATAALAETGSAAAQEEFAKLAASKDHLIASAAARRQQKPLANPDQTLSETARNLLARAEQVHDQEKRFTSRPGLWSRQARITRVLLAANLVMFALELALGGSTNPETLRRLGAVYLHAVQHGEWWRLLAGLFLHYGSVHLGLNLLALAWLGPFVERFVGATRFLTVYLLAGIGSSAATLLKMATLSHDEFLVGASGSIMGLVGAITAIALRGWRRERARPASRLLWYLLTVLVAQTVFDLFIPQVSLTAHLAGVVLGFLITSLFSGSALGIVNNPAQD